MRLEIHGTVYSEPFSMGLSARGDDQYVLFDLGSANEFLSQAEPDVTTWINAVKGYTGAGVTFQGLKVRGYDDAGVLKVVAEKPLAAAITGATSAGLPGYVAACHTLLTDTPGRQNRGRVYLPISSPNSMAQNGKLNIKADLALRMKEFIQNLQNSPGIDAIVGGFKIVVQSKVLNGHQTDVTKVRVGDVPDAQRRRNNNMLETFALETI